MGEGNFKVSSSNPQSDGIVNWRFVLIKLGNNPLVAIVKNSPFCRCFAYLVKDVWKML